MKSGITPRVGRPRLLARPEDVEIPRRHGLEAVAFVNIWESSLGDKFLERVRRQRRGTHVLAFGQRAALPYAAEDAAKTRRLTPASRAATSTCTVASTLARFEPSGSFTERGTEGIAAW